MKNGLPVVTLLLAIAAGCGGDSQTQGEKACKDLSAKLAECHLAAQGVCNAGAACSVECAAQATCSDLTAAQPGGAYLSCILACSGADPDAFVCADGQHYLPRAGVCNGVPQCPDGSDEATCGAADAGPG